MSNIRVTYSGLIALTAGLVSVLTGSFFTILVTRRLLPEEFGVWSLIGNIVSYFMMAEIMISFWATRQIVRGEQVGKTAILSSLMVSIGSIPLYLILSYFVSHTSNVSITLMMFGVILVPVSFLSQTLTSINLAHKPHATSYGLIIFELCKIPAGLSFVYFFHLGVEGAIAATLLAYISKIIIQLIFAKSKLKGKFALSSLRRWMKISWIPLYSRVANLIWSLDVIVYSVITGSVLGVAYYGVSVSITALMTHAGMITQALYPKLIANGKQDYIQVNLTRVLYFALPLLGISIIFSKPALFALNPS